MTAAAHHDQGLDDLGPEALLDALTDADRREREAARDKLRIAHQWAVLHPATEDTGTSTWGGDSMLLVEESLGGDGCPTVAAYAAEPLAVTLGVAPSTAQQLLADALDLRHRLPQTWKLLDELQVPAWKARQVARTTHQLPLEGARWVDEQLAKRLKRCGARLIDQYTAQAIAKFQPDRHAEKEQQAKSGSDVTLYTPTASEFAGRSELHITGDTLFLTALYRYACDQAAQSGKDGDQRPLGVRKVDALRTLVETGGRPAPVTKPKTALYLHLDLEDLQEDLVKAGRVERLGPATTAQIREWAGGSEVTIRPVIWMTADDAVDGHDPPEPMREQVILRDPTCRFPNCQVDSRRCDLDHIVPYDPTGPPGQTRPSNLAPLCRRHHNAKTTGLWRYTRTPEGAYHWTGPRIASATS